MLSTSRVELKDISVVIFGDPLNGLPVLAISAAKVKEFCANGDIVCQRKGNLLAATAAHESYGGSAAEAADFISKL